MNHETKTKPPSPRELTADELCVSAGGEGTTEGSTLVYQGESGGGTIFPIKIKHNA